MGNEAKNDVVKKTEYDRLVRKVNDIKTTDTSDLVKKADYDQMNDCDKYITTQELNKLTADNFTERLAQAKLATKADIADFV